MRYLDRNGKRIKHNGHYVYMVDRYAYPFVLDGVISWNRTFQGYIFTPDNPDYSIAVVSFIWRGEGSSAIAKDFHRSIKEVLKI